MENNRNSTHVFNLQKIADGDTSAFRLFYDNYRNGVYNYAFKIIHSTTLAEEIVQDVFMKIWDNRLKLPGMASYEAYLFTIVRNTTFNVFKKIAKEKEKIKRLSPVMSTGHNSTSDLLLNKEYQVLLNRAINQLPPQQQLVYSLSREEGLTREQIARQLNISPQTVKAHLHQALRFISSWFKSHLYFFLPLSLYFS